MVPSPKSNRYVAIGVASLSVEPEASAVTERSIVPVDGVIDRTALGGASPAGRSSYAPRSSNVRDPAPVFAVAGSSKRAMPSTSEAGCPLTPESAESIAGEPAVRWKSGADLDLQRGSASMPCASCPVADRKEDRDV